MAVQHADAGADVVSTTAMLDGLIRVVRAALDEAGHRDVGVNPNLAIHTGLYGPFKALMVTDPRSGHRARHHLGADPRVEFVTADADAWLTVAAGPYDFAYVDCRPGKYLRLDDLLALLSPGALYVVDDMLPRVTWSDDHQPRVDGFLERLPEVANFRATPMRWASGLVVAARL
ncbi:hypothetical protein MTF65_21900 [Streptomyces sp. APSN-46.1]|nr:hypothetical protein [Streptomyces sp. APSN-46.1]